LEARLAPLARRTQVVGNALDERIWLPGRRGPVDRYGPVRILCMGTATHDTDFAGILPALTEIHRQFGDQIQIDLIGFVSATDVPAWIRRLAPSPHATRSYPGFVQWVTGAGPWDVGLAPLADSPFNACKSAIKVLDYAALGLASLASGVPAYRGSLADGPGGMLVPNTTPAWYEALSRLIRDAAFRRGLAEGGAASLRAGGTLAARAGAWRRAWPRVNGRKPKLTL
jgi:glycosyltransferase involved in cell wall biosynthesis